MKSSERGVTLLAVVMFLVLLALVAAIGLTYRRWEWQPPQISFDRELKALPKTAALNVKIEDTGNPLRHVAIRLNQKDQEVVLADESFEGTENSKSYDIGKLLAEKYKVQEGPATLVVSATDNALGHYFGGNTGEVTKEFSFDISPPRLEVLSGQHYINHGGSESVVYRVSEDTVVHGVRVGPNFFPGFPVPSDPSLRFALFAFAYNLPRDTSAQVIARDAAGNESIAGFWQKVFPKPFRSRDIVIEDSFLQKVVPEILSNTPAVQDQGELIKTFVAINSQLRHQNHAAIAEKAKESPGQFLWNGAFLQLSNSQVESLFADRRTYVYQGKPVDEQDHVGFDLSVVEHYPIEAANDGKIVLAEYFGIYGNTVLIDHGAGLISLYGHMSSMDVKPGDMVKKKQVLGKSGATGLAGGDHLHFGLFLHGVPINPTEWWDEKWIREHVLDRMKPGAGA